MRPHGEFSTCTNPAIFLNLKLFFTLQNLPRLNFLDMSFNQLKTFDFDFFDQVGMLASLKVNVSHNDLWELNDNTTSFISAREQGNNCHFSLHADDMINVKNNLNYQIYAMISFQELFIHT